MKTILVEMSDRDFEKFAKKREKIDFETLQKRVLAEAFQNSIDEAVREAQESGLSSMTLADINEEIQAVRNPHE